MKAARFCMCVVALCAGLFSLPCFASCNAPANAIEAENCLAGNSSAEWDVSGAGDVSIQGFATDISVNQGDTVHFKISSAAPYTMDIYRMGYYGGMGARKVASPGTLGSPLPVQTQPACLNDPATGLNDCGNWAESANWAVPSTATSGIYFARLARTDTGGASHIFFIVRNDSSHSDLLFQTSDTTWQAYNSYLGNSLYVGNPAGRAYKVSYNRPFFTRGGSGSPQTETESPADFVFNAEYPMVRFLESNGYDVTYFTGVDADRNGALIQNHKVYLSVGHDEYWSGNQRANVETARNNGVNLAFFSGNESFWKTRWEASIDGSNTPYRTLVSYKETHNNAPLDPMDPPIWTGTWRDKRFSPPADGGRPENGMTGTIFMVNCCTYGITVPSSDGRMRFWRNTPVATQSPEGSFPLPNGTLGYEWDADLDNGSRPAGLFHLSNTPISVPQMLLDNGSNYGPGVVVHNLTLYRAYNANKTTSLVFGGGTVQWSWGLDSNHDNGSNPPDPSMQQATINLFADMGVQPATLQVGMTPATASTDTTPPTSVITFPTSNGSVASGVAITITGTAADAGGGVVGGVEISVDGGATWHPAVGRETWSYNWTPSTGTSATILSRAVDDSGNLEGSNGNALSSVMVTVTPPPPPVCPCSIWTNAATPAVSSANDQAGGIENGVRFQSDNNGYITGLRFYKGAGNTGTHIGQLWDNTGALLGSVTFTGESSSGWQEADFANPVAIAASTTYVASIYSSAGFYPYTDFYFTQPVNTPPLHALQDGADGVNGSYVYTNTPAFPTQTFHSANYWVDVVFNTTIVPNNTPPTVTANTPANGAQAVAVNTTVTATFSKPMNPATLTATTFTLTNAGNIPVAAAVTYDQVFQRATLTPNNPLAYSTSYTATVTTGVQDLNGNAMAAQSKWNFTTSAPPPPPPNTGPGGPILVISSTANPFSSYYAEILRNEGFNEFTVSDISLFNTPSDLSPYDLVILGDFALTSSQANMISTWVNGGGNLIAMRPDKQLAGMLGLNDDAATLSNAYLLVNTTSGPGAGITNQTIQFHSAADRYTLNGATSYATLYSNATTATASPAVTLANFGAGQAAAFTFDLARSVSNTRQGNPAWSGQERDGITPIRSDDLFYGAAASDPEPDWIDLSKVAIPQADEQQRLLANLILQMNLARKPLPRFWYFPRGFQAVVVMTGDDHANGGTSGRFQTFFADSAANCSLDDWQCLRGTSYVYPATSVPDAQTFVSEGFEIGLHVLTNCADWTPASLEDFYATQLSQFAAAFPTLPAPQTNRTHCIAWSDYDTQPQVELNHGIRFDVNYYYWPPNWINNVPGMFTGSGMPMRFTKLDGTLIDVYQATTQMTDESGQSYPFTIDTLLANALGPLGYYGAFTANMHTDNPVSDGANAIVASAQSRGVPIVTSLQMLHWLDGRNGSSFGSLSWDGSHLSFDIALGTHTGGIQAMLPSSSTAGTLKGITLNGAPMSFATQTIKGMSYAVFSAAAGAYVANYGVDTTPPVISSIVATPHTDGTATITWTTDKLSSSVVNYGTSASSLSLTATTAGLVTSHTVTLSGLTPNSTYYYQVVSADSIGNTATAPATPNNFLMPSASVSDGSVADFSGGSGSCSVVRGVNGGEVILTPTLNSDFGGTALPNNWVANPVPWQTGGSVSFNGTAAVVSGISIASTTTYGPGSSMDFVATFTGSTFQHVGFVTDLNFDLPWALFSTGQSGGALYARVSTANDILIPGNWLNAPHHFRIDWTSTGFVFSIDGNVVATQNIAITSTMVAGASDFNGGGGSVSVNWLRVSPYGTSCAYSSRVFDGGSAVNWGAMSWTSDTPAGTTLGMSYRIGNTATPDGTWTSFTPVSPSGASLSGNGRYIQYQAALGTTDTTRTPDLTSVSITFAAGAPVPPVITTQSPAPNATNVSINTNVAVGFSEPMDPTTITTASFRLRPAGGSSDLAATVTYANGVATLAPAAALNSSTQYQVTVAGTVTNTTGTALGSDVTLTFTTGIVTLTHTDTTVADFSAGSGTCQAVAHYGDGEVILAAALDQEFNSGFPADWSINPFTGGTATVQGGLLFVDGADTASNTAFGPGTSLEAVATFTADQFQHIGFVSDLNFDTPFAIFSTAGTTNTLFARTYPGNGNVDFPIPNPVSGTWIGSPHRFRIDWTVAGFTYSIDGNPVHTEALAIGANMHPVVSDFNNNGLGVSVDWLVVTPYNSPCSFQSAVFDAGSSATWLNLSWDALTPANTSLALSYRTGNTAIPDNTWSAFAPVGNSGGSLAGASRFIQYEADLNTSDLTQTPVLEDVTISYTLSNAPSITTQPASQTINSGQTATLSVVAMGSVPLSYQWYQGNSGDASNPISGATSSSFTTPALTTTISYWVQVTNPAGSANSSTGTVTVNQPPMIISQPADLTINRGQTAALGVAATGATSYQWYIGSSGDASNPISGATSNSLITPPLTTTISYWVAVTNAAGTVKSTTATVTVNQPPVINTQPSSVAINVGQSTTLTVTASSPVNGLPITYQWYVGNSGDLSSPISGAHSPNLMVSPSTTTNYWVAAANAAGTTESNTATVTVNNPPTINTQPGSLAINLGQSATLSVTAASTLTLSYQWYQGNTGDTTSPIVGATNSSVNVSPTTTTSYWVQVTNTAGSANSTTATVTVNQPPSITTQPASQTINSGQTATLSVVATGAASYQWYIGSSPVTTSPINGATNSSLNVSPATTTSYWVAVSNAAGATNSSTVIVTVNQPPVISTQPASVTISAGQSTTLTVAASSPQNLTITYQWYTGNSSDTSSPITGGTSPSLIVSPATTTSYWVQVTNTAGSVNSSTATVTVNQPPAINTQPASQTINLGQSATLSVTATSTLPLSYQWYVGNSPVTTSPINGATNSSLNVSPATTTSYWVQVTNTAGSVNSSTATVTVNQPPAINTQPASQAINVGQSATLSVSATSTLPLSYQWYVGNSPVTTSPINGATNSSLNVSPATTTSYWVQVTNTAGSVNSSTATVTVNQPPVINTQPASQTITSGKSATLSVTATGAGLGYQWYVGSSGVTSSPVTGATGSSFTTPVLYTTTSYWVQVSNAAGTKNSNTAVITVNQPSVKLSATLVSFGNQALNTTSVAKKVIVTNQGPGVLAITGVIASGDFAASSCPSTLASGSTCTVSVTFTPTALGARTGSLTISDNGASSPQTVALSGTGIVQLSLSSTTITFGTQAVGTTSNPKAVTLTNNGAQPISFTSVSAAGDFLVSTDGCSPTLPAFSKCSINVEFAPAATGTRNGMLTIQDSASNSPQTVSLSGTGLVPMTLSPTSKGFGPQPVGTTSSPQTFTLKSNLPFSTSVSIATTGDFLVSGSTCGSSLGAGGSCSITVVFKPATKGPRSGALSVTDAAVNSPQTSSLSGVGK